VRFPLFQLASWSPTVTPKGEARADEIPGPRQEKEAPPKRGQGRNIGRSI
jgi:hypothetical protein